MFEGDERNSEQMGLASMQTLWVREHNRIASSLTTSNPTWESERVFLVRNIYGIIDSNLNQIKPNVQHRGVFVYVSLRHKTISILRADICKSQTLGVKSKKSILR